MVVSLSVTISLIGLFLLILGFILAFTVGADKRLGLGWSLFFVLCGVLPGIIFIILSPSKKNLPPPKKSDISYNVFFGFLLLLGAAATFYQLFNMSQDEVDAQSTAFMLGRLIRMVFGLAGAYYFFNRYQRHKQLYEMQNPI